MKITLLSSLFLFFYVSMSHANDQKIVAEVNGTKITHQEVLDYYIQSLKIVSTRKVTMKSALQELINRELGLQKAKNEKINLDPVVKRKIEDIMYHAQISKDLEDKFGQIQVSDAEVKNYYRNNPEYRTAHVLYRLTVTPTPEQVEAAYSQAYEVYNKVKDNPKSFAEIATQANQSSAAAFAGDIGFQPPTALAPEYYAAIRGKNPGYISQPVRSQYGYHVIKIIDVRKLEDIKINVYKKIIYDQKRDQIIEDYFQALAKNSKIIIKDPKLKS